MSLSDKYRRLADTILHERAWGQFKDNDALTLDEWKLIDTALRVMADAAPSTRETGQWCPSCGTAMVDVPFEPIAAQQVPPVRGGDDVRETEGLAALKPSQPVAQFSATLPTALMRYAATRLHRSKFIADKLVARKLLEAADGSSDGGSHHG